MWDTLSNVSGKGGKPLKINIPSREDFIKGIQEFEKHEKRDAMYKVATFLVSHFWGNPYDMANALGVLLLTWNQAFYRYGSFDFDKLEKSIDRNLDKLEKFRKMDIDAFSNDHIGLVMGIFDDFMDSLQISSGKMKGRKSPVAVSKALHLLAPRFFPLWDDKIARVYRCYYNPNPAIKYIKFMTLMKEFAIKIKNRLYISDFSHKTLLKLIDEYNYSKYTKGWI